MVTVLDSLERGKTMGTAIIGDISGLAVLTSLGYLVCRDCWKKPEIKAEYGKHIVSKSGRVVHRGDTYSDEICDICGNPVDC